MGVTYVAYNTPGGRALKHSYVQRFQLKRDSYIDENGKDMGTNPESPQGAIFQVSYVKNKVTKNDRRMQTFTLKFDSGVDVLADTTQLAIHLNIIAQSGKWFSYGDKKWDGKSNLIAELKENEELFNEILFKTNEMAIA
jgi:recombination protein RecA